MMWYVSFDVCFELITLDFVTFCLNIKLNPMFKLYVTVTYMHKVNTEKA